jgi:hypothetical protein
MKATVGAVLLLAGIVACELPPGLSNPDYGPCQGEVAIRWVIAGLSGARVTYDATGVVVTVVMTLGETVRLRVQSGGGCVATLSSVSWSSSNPAVATLSPIGPDEASLTTVGLGETVVSARLTFADSPSQVVAPQVSIDGGVRPGLFDVSQVRVVASSGAFMRAR